MSARFRPHPAPRTEPVRGPARFSPAPVSAPPAPSPQDSRRGLLRAAEALGIPWQRLLREEIAAERSLRRYGGGEDGERIALDLALAVLPSTFLASWRVRDQVEALSCEARGASFRAAIRRLKAVHRRLVGKPAEDEAYGGHLWMAYQRVLLLQRVCRAARRVPGTTGAAAERVTEICAREECSADDAAWAICLEATPRPGHRLDEAIRKARAEGFQIPRAATEAQAFAWLRRVVRARPGYERRRVTRSPRDRAALPARVALPTGAR